MYNERFSIDSTIRRPEGSCRGGYGDGGFPVIYECNLKKFLKHSWSCALNIKYLTVPCAIFCLGKYLNTISGCECIVRKLTADFQTGQILNDH